CAMRWAVLREQEIPAIGTAPSLHDGLFVEKDIWGWPKRGTRLSGGILIHEIEFAPEIKEQAAADVHRSLVDYLVVRRDPLLDKVGRVSEREIRCHSRHAIHHAEANRHHRGGEGGESQPRPFFRDKPEGDDREKNEGEPGGDKHRAKTQPGGNRDFAQSTPGRGTRRGRTPLPAGIGEEIRQSPRDKAAGKANCEDAGDAEDPGPTRHAFPGSRA